MYCSMQKLRVLVLFLCVAGASYGQRGRVDIQGDVGWTGFLDDRIDDHVLWAASVRLYLTKQLNIQPEFQYLTRSSGSGHYDLVGVVNVSYDLRSPGARIVPYLTIGPGIISSHEVRFANNTFFLSGGGGVKVSVGKRWYVAPEVRIGIEPHARFSVGLGYVLR